MITRSECYINIPESSDQIFSQRWTPTDGVKATILLTHGVAEHSEAHHYMANTLAQNSYEVIAWDLPGHGRSYGQRGYISSFDEYLERLHLMIDYSKSEATKDKPLFLFGHSLGGLIVFSYGLKYLDANYDGMYLSSPAFGVSAKVPPAKDIAARILNKIAPRITIKHEINYSDLSRDSELVNSYRKDPLRHKKFSAPLYLGMLEAIENAHSRAHLLKQPIFIQAGESDRITSTDSTKKLFNKISSPKKALKLYPNSYHEIFNDINQQEVIDDLLSSLRQL